jgi:FkbM family methyltransferase
MSTLSHRVSQSTLALYRFIFARPQLYSFNLHLYKLALRGLGVLNSEGSGVTGETYFFSWLQKNRPQLSTVIDVGANTGTYTQELLEFFPDARVICLEPNPHTFALLKGSLVGVNRLRKTTEVSGTGKTTRLGKKQNKVKRPAVVLEQLGASNRSGKQTLWDFADTAPLKQTQPNSTLASVHKNVVEELHHQPAQAVEIAMITLDKLAQKHKFITIDLLKIDTEGHELAVLQGARRLIAQGRIGVVQLEFNEMNAFSGVFLREIMTLLPNHAWFRLLPSGLLPLGEYRPVTHEIFGFQNLVAVPLSS